MARTIAGVSDDAVRAATGEGWAHWLSLLDDRDATAMTHAERVAALADAGVESPWYRQQLAVGYEQERDLREVGETADAGFQVGVQRTLPVPKASLWDRLTRGDGLATWLGEVGKFSLDQGARYETAAGTTGEVRTVRPGERLRLTWQPRGRDEPTTLQVTLSCPRNAADRTTLRIHHERLRDGAEREAMAAHWRGVLDDLESLVS